MNKGFERHDKETAELRQEMDKEFELVNRHISALGARWRLIAEEAFRGCLNRVLEKELRFKAGRHAMKRAWCSATQVEVVVTIKDGRLILIEVSSHI